MIIEIYKRSKKDEYVLSFYDYLLFSGDKEFVQLYLDFKTLKELKDRLNKMRL